MSGLYSITTPRFEASDELWHYPMVQYMAVNDYRLPVQQPGVETALRQEGSQPPLYYFMAALLTSGIDTSDLDHVRRVNPHSDIGLVRPDGNVNMMVHRPELDGWGWSGTRLAVQVARLLSVLLGLGTVIVTYALARELFPERPGVAVTAAALNALLPMFLFISGSVNNDNLSNLLGNLLTLLIVILLKTPRPGWKLYGAIGVVTGAGLLAKLNIGFLIPIIALALLIVSIRQRSIRPLLIGGMISGGLTIALAGWWYVRNVQLYGDPTGLNVFLDIVGRRAIPANAAQLWAERHSFTQAFWGFFGGVNVPLPETVYLIFNVIGGVGLVSAVIFLLVQLVRRAWPLERWLVIAVTVIWPIVTFISYLRWTAETPASQGRLVFGALSAILIWIAVGWSWAVPRRVRPWISSGLIAWFGAIALAAPFLVIAPAYARPALLDPLPEAELRGSFADAAGPIVGLRPVTERGQEVVYPGNYVFVDTAWQMLRQPDRDWSLFVHLVTPDGVILAQRDLYPGGGTLATSDLAPGAAWHNPIAVFVPDTAYTPMPLTIVVGWYHLPTGDRLRLADGAETFALGTVELRPRPSALNVPNPISVNFDRQIELVGYEFSDISPAAGDTLTLTLYWRALQPVTRDYVVFAHLIDPPTLTIYAGSDAQPVGWTRPTSTWEVGEIVADTHTMTVRPDTPPGIYEFEVGLYQQLPDGFPRLRIVTPDGGMANDYIYLTRLRVLPEGS